MKKIINILFVFILLISITGCTTKHRGPRQISLFGEELPDASSSANNGGNNNSNENNNNNNGPIKEDYGDRSSNVSWIGKYKIEGSKLEDIIVEISAEAGSDDLVINASKNVYVYDNPNEDGYSIISSSYLSASLSDITDDTITYDDIYSGFKFTITKTDDGIKIDILEDNDGTHADMAGTYIRNSDSINIKGYYTNDNGEVAVSPVGSDYAKVSARVYADGDYYLYLQIYSVEKGALTYVDGAGETAKIVKTSKGIKITTNITGLAGEYELEK